MRVKERNRTLGSYRLGSHSKRDKKKWRKTEIDSRARARGRDREREREMKRERERQERERDRAILGISERCGN